jgi:regulation of enolase protein 1 (concanavalin A-like superfamily)
MDFELLQDFDWYHEPENVRFDADSMVVYAKAGTDYWQSLQHGFKKDDGHFFFCRQAKDFTITLSWQPENPDKFSQCGLMLRSDERNWFKAALMQEVDNRPVLMSSLTISGHSEWSGFPLYNDGGAVWFRLVRKGDDYTFFYSLDGEHFIKARQFYLESFDEVKTGAYVAAPQQKNFSAKLTSVKLGGA